VRKPPAWGAVEHPEQCRNCCDLQFAAEGFGEDGGRRFEDRGVLVRPPAIFIARAHHSDFSPESIRVISFENMRKLVDHNIVQNA
jgi:hypothetical protein